MSRHHHAIPWAVWQRTRRRVFDRDGWRCVRCGNAGRLECHHKVPMTAGGAALDLANLETLCRRCHVAESRRERRRPTEREAAWRRFADELRPVAAPMEA